MNTVRTVIVDDDFLVAKVHGAYTERVAGFEVVGVAHSGHEALEVVERVSPDLLVLDIHLPDMSGLEVLQELRHRRSAVDAIVVTAAKDVDSLRTAMAAGALRYIVKPFNFDRFRDALQSYQRFIGRRAALEAVEQDDVDRLYASMAAPPDQSLPKNLHRPTLDLVVSCLHEESESLSALDVADRTGLSRATARRYLEYLEACGRAVMQLRYGAAGRPEHRYRLAEMSIRPS
ncbi:MAG: response regulator [Chloroflexi bacterium]|nr:response regulator [Chloroflexota bacterium]MBV9544066.1 response regulator [Chloroflexota bacterium]